MHLLYVVPFVPWRVRVRSYNLIPRLARRHEIFLVCLAGSAEEEARIQSLQTFCKDICCVHHHAFPAILRSGISLATRVPLRMAYFSSTAMRNAVRQAAVAFSPDLIYLERWRALQYIPTDTQLPILCDPTDSMWLYNRRLLRTGSWHERVVARAEALKFLSYEPRLSARATVNVFCSSVDLECVRSRAPHSRFAIIPNGVDCQQFYFKDSSEEDAATIIFTGSFTHSPNRHAMKFFIQRIFPIVKRRVPRTRLVIVGNEARRRIGELNGDPSIEIVDFVPDLRPALAKAAVAIAPLTFGVGVTNKVLEAFATGTAVVASPVACGDLPVWEGEHLLLANDAPSFAEKVIRLLVDRSFRQYLAQNARRLVEQHYDWEIVANRMEGLMQELVTNRQTRTRSQYSVSTAAFA